MSRIRLASCRSAVPASLLLVLGASALWTSAWSSDCGPAQKISRDDYVPDSGVEEPADPEPKSPTPPSDPPPPTTPRSPDTPTDPAARPPDPTTPTAPTTPTTPVTPAGPTTPDSPSGRGAGAAAAGDRRRSSGRDPIAWEVWWAVHRFEFLVPADHSAEWTPDSGAASTVPTTRATMHARLLALSREAQDYGVRGAALAAAIRLATPDEVGEMGPAVREALRSHNLKIAMSVGNALSYSTSTPLVAAVHPVAKDKNLEAHVRGLVVLGLPGLWHDAADQALVEFLKDGTDDDAPFIEGVLMALGSTRGPTGAAALERVVADTTRSPAHRATALTSLARRGLDARDRLVAALSDRQVEVRRAAATGLGVLPWAAPAVDATPVAALRQAGDVETAEALEAMLARLAEDRAMALREGPARETCVRLGRVLLSEHDRSVRAAAAISLGRIARSAGATSAARILLADLARTRDLRQYELLALGISRDPLGIPACLAALRAEKSPPTTRAAAAIALGLAGVRPAVSALVGLLEDDPSPDVRGFAAVALGMVGEPSSLPAIRAAFSRVKSPDATSNLAIALGLFGDRRDAAMIAERLERGGSRRQLFNLVEALRLAGRTGPTAALAKVAEDSESDASTDAIRAIAGILAPNDGGKAARAPAFDHLSAEDYLLAYVVDP